MLVLGGGGEAAHKRQPQREVGDVLVLTDDVESAKWPAEHVKQRQDAGQAERRHQDALFGSL